MRETLVSEMRSRKPAGCEGGVEWGGDESGWKGGGTKALCALAPEGIKFDGVEAAGEGGVKHADDGAEVFDHQIFHHLHRLVSQALRLDA